VDGYSAVKQVARKQDQSWLPIIRDIHAVITLQVAQGKAAHVDTRWLRMQTGRDRYPSLTPLVRWGVLTEKVWYGNEGELLPKSGRNYYEMPDREGVGRALDELGVAPTELRS
jgi:hypothetical protein